MEQDLEALRAAGLLTRDARTGVNQFDHALTHEATYQLVSFAAREQLHRRTAEQLEELHRARLSTVHARLGHHYRMARMPAQAVPHLAAAGTPPDIIAKLYPMLLQVMESPDVRKRLGDGGVEVVTSKSPEEFAAFLRAETERWTQVVKDSGATVD